RLYRQLPSTLESLYRVQYGTRSTQHALHIHPAFAHVPAIARPGKRRVGDGPEGRDCGEQAVERVTASVVERSAPDLVWHGNPLHTRERLQDPGPAGAARLTPSFVGSIAAVPFERRRRTDLQQPGTPRQRRLHRDDA